LSASNALELAFLKHPQQGDLGFRRHLTDLIQKKRSPIGRLKATDAPLHRSSKGAFFMSKSPSPEMSGSDQAAQTPLLKARFRASSGHRGSFETSGIITRCFVKAAVPHEPVLGPIFQGVMAALKVAGT
jgi:hypothetical protein